MIGPTSQLDLNGSEDGTGAALAYTENDAASRIAPVAELYNWDSVDFDAVTLKIAFGANGAAADQLAILSEGAGPGEVDVSGFDISYGGVIVGTYSGGDDGSDLVVTFNGDATPEAAQALIQAITYRNDSDDPSTAARAISFTIADNAGTSVEAQAIVNVSSDDMASIAVQSDGTDQAAIINAALANSHSSILTLPPGEFWIGSPIFVPEGKTLVGAGQNLSAIKLLPDFDISDGAVGIMLQGQSGVSDLTLDVNKVNNGEALSQRVNGVLALGTDFLVENVTSKNATGYAFWSNGQSSSTPASGVFRDCFAENSNILFETNFSDGVLFENCRGGDGDADILALGAFHPLAGSSNITFRDCYYKGSAIAIDALANVGAQTNIVFERFYGETTGSSLAAIIHGAGTNEVLFRDSTIIAANNVAISIHNSTVNAFNSDFQSISIAFAVYSGSAHVENSTAVASANADYNGAVFGAYALGTVVWNGGSLSATGGPGTAAFRGDVSVSPSTDLATGGTADSDRLVSNIGADVLTGFGGDDVYYVDDAGDVVVEGVDGGSDTVWSSVSYALGANVQVETLSTVAHGSTAAISLFGNGFANTLYGNAGGNRLNGGGGADVLVGFGGNDAYYVDNIGDIVVEGASGGLDTIWTTTSYVLAAGVEVETLSTATHGDMAAIDLTGNEYANALYGNAGDNRLNGGGGIDVLRGFGGNDVYYVDNVGDVVVEGADGGSDTVWTSVSYALAADVQVETLSALDVDDTTAISLFGNGFANALNGNAGGNRLNGGGGADVLTGFDGDDVYYVDDAGDVVVEGVDGGSDTVWTSVSYALGANVQVETLSTVAHGSTAAISLFGNEFANALYGNAGGNQLNGGGGVDVLVGFEGNDAYYVDNISDVVIEGSSGGSDTVWASTSYRLGAGVHVETLSTVAHRGTAAIDLTGNELANALYGNAGDNRLNGGGGADVLRGFGGNDTFLFDQPLGPGNVATILDFAPGTDGILLDNDVFEGLLEGELSASAFHTGTAAADTNHRIIYDPTGGQLYFDADGSGSIAAVLFGIVQPSLDLSPTDFSVI